MKSTNAEWLRALIVFALASYGGWLTEHWALCYLASVIGLCGWLYFKLYELNDWLDHNATGKNMPEGSGIWADLYHRVLTVQRKSLRRKKKMALTLQRTRRLVRQLPFATVVLNADNEIEWCNARSGPLLGLNAQLDTGLRIDNLLRNAEFRALLNYQTNKEIDMRSPVDNALTLSVHYIPVDDQQKLLIARDVSERISLQSMQRTFVANASHELKTPLTVIAGYLELLASDEQLTEEAASFVSEARQQSDKMQRLIKDLLTLSRMDSHYSVRSETEIDLSATVLQVCAEAKELSSKHEINHSNVSLNVGITGKEFDIASAVSNLVFNAVRHTKIDTEVTVSLLLDDSGDVILSVADEGKGIQAVHLKKLTQRFYRVPQADNSCDTGTGLGLAIVDQVAKAHGIKLMIESTRGEGSRFELVFPASIVSIKKIEAS